jgi:hypothetical protein
MHFNRAAWETEVTPGGLSIINEFAWMIGCFRPNNNIFIPEIENGCKFRRVSPADRLVVPATLSSRLLKREWVTIHAERDESIRHQG